MLVLVTKCHRNWSVDDVGRTTWVYCVETRFWNIRYSSSCSSQSVHLGSFVLWQFSVVFLGSYFFSLLALQGRSELTKPLLMSLVVQGEIYFPTRATRFGLHLFAHFNKDFLVCLKFLSLCCYAPYRLGFIRFLSFSTWRRITTPGHSFLLVRKISMKSVEINGKDAPWFLLSFSRY